MTKRYDHVKITNVTDGTTIEGHDAVAAHFEREQALFKEHGATLTFHLYRANLAGATSAELQGPRLAELRIEGSEVSGTDTVAAVKARVLPKLLADQARAAHITFVFGGRVMDDEALFYAAHRMMLPCWVQVVLSDVPFSEVLVANARLPA